MAMDTAHSLYHLGMIKNNNQLLIHLHCSCTIADANNYYLGAGLNLNNIRLANRYNLYVGALIALLKKESVIFIGIHLWQAIIFLPLMIYNRDVLIHLHGQAHALKVKSLKYFVWWIISHYSKLVVSNPAWIGVSFVKQIENLNHLHSPNLKHSKSKDVIFYSAVGKRPRNITELLKRLKLKGLTLVLVDKKLSYENLNNLLRNAGFLYFECVDDYYLYSPSGRISDALNYGLKLVLRTEDSVGISIANKYSIEFMLI